MQYMISLEYIILLIAFEIQSFKTCFLGCVYTNNAESQLTPNFVNLFTILIMYFDGISYTNSTCKLGCLSCFS